MFFGRRYYSPEVGRFLTPDPLGFGDGLNLYSYVHNSPLILLDPYGLSISSMTDGMMVEATPELGPPDVTTLNDGTKIVERELYSEQVIMYPEGNRGFIEKYHGMDLGNSVKLYVNGADTTLYEACKNAQTIINQSENGKIKHVMIGYNATDNFFIDLGHVAQASAGLPAKSVDDLANHIIDYCKSCKDAGIKFNNGPAGHSEGSVALINMRQKLEKNRYSREFLNFNKMSFYGELVLQGGDVRNYAAWCDPAALFAIHNAALQEDPYFDNILHNNVTMVGGFTDPISAHAFLGRGYQQALSMELKSEPNQPARAIQPNTEAR